MSQHLEELRRALQDYVPSDPTEDNGVLTGYIVVATWSTADGNEWITRTAGSINDTAPAVWTIKGLLQHALDRADEDWMTRADEDEADDDAA